MAWRWRLKYGSTTQTVYYVTKEDNRKTKTKSRRCYPCARVTCQSEIVQSPYDTLIPLHNNLACIGHSMPLGEVTCKSSAQDFIEILQKL
jgi:hypothetical protein